jgi:pimeloyl-ACP methyl ester carboxylesterase
MKPTNDDNVSTAPTRKLEKNTVTRRRFLAGAATVAAASGLFRSQKLFAASEPVGQDLDNGGPLVIKQQGSFFAGGTKMTAPGTFDPTKDLFSSPGDTYWDDALYAQYQIPPDARSLPLVLVHGGGQTGKSWETTPDGRDGYQTIFLRRGFSVYIVDDPRRGRAGFPSFTGTLGALGTTQVIPDLTLRYGESASWLHFRLGPTPGTYFPNSQFPRAGLDQYLKQAIPQFGDDQQTIVNGLIALLERIGPAILVGHSQTGPIVLLAATQSSKVKAVIAYESIGFWFPAGAVPTPPPLWNGTQFTASANILAAMPIAPADFQKLTKIPIQIIYGDNIPTTPVPVYGFDEWRVLTTVGREFVAAVNARGGNASYLSLPEAGLFGNTHFAFSDLNNVRVADLLSEFLHARGLDR